MASRRTRTCARRNATWHALAPSTPRRGRRCSRPRRRWRSAPATSPVRSRPTPANKETSMAHKRDDDQSSNVSETIGLLVRAADGDTLVRDLYLLRARELIAPVCAESRYRSVVGEREEAERSLQHARLAAGRRDWERVRELSSRAAALQQDLQTTQDVSALAQSVYDAPAVALDAFSPGVTAPGTDARSMHADVLEALGRLETADAAKKDLYAARRAAVAALEPPGATPAASAAKAADSDEHRLRLATERGDAEQLRELAEKMLSGSSTTGPTARDAAAKRTR